VKEKRRSLWGGHILLMTLCCAIPLGAIALLSLLGVLGSWGFYGLILLCPLLHFVFMRRLFSKTSESGSSENRMMGPEGD
jgi:hypothetical protein